MSVSPGGAPRRSMAEVQDEIIAEMAACANRLAKYEYLVGLGRALDVADDGLRTDQHALAGCQSSVWIRTRLQDGRLRIDADSDTMITRGIIALLLRVLDNRPLAEIVETELRFLDATGLSMHLSPARANGLAAMVRHIREAAADARASLAADGRAPTPGEA